MQSVKVNIFWLIYCLTVIHSRKNVYTYLNLLFITSTWPRRKIFNNTITITKKTRLILLLVFIIPYGQNNTRCISKIRRNYWRFLTRLCVIADLNPIQINCWKRSFIKRAECPKRLIAAKSAIFKIAVSNFRFLVAQHRITEHYQYTVRQDCPAQRQSYHLSAWPVGNAW